MSCVQIKLHAVQNISPKWTTCIIEIERKNLIHKKWVWLFVERRFKDYVCIIYSSRVEHTCSISIYIVCNMLIAQTFFSSKIKVLTEHLTKFSFYPLSHLCYLCLQQICICNFIYVQLHFFGIFWHFLCVKPEGCLICVFTEHELLPFWLRTEVVQMYLPLLWYFL